jgi:hypothetical protein
MLAGSTPFRNPSPAAVLKGHLQDPPPRLEKIRADLPEGLAYVAERLLAKKSEERFATAEETLDALSGVRDPSRTVTFHKGTGPTLPDLPPPPRRRRITPARALGAALAVVVAVLAVLAIRGLLGPKEYPGRRTPEDALATIHRALERRDYQAFAECFEEEALLEYLSDEPQRVFAERTEGLADFAFRAEVPHRGPGREDLSLRVVSGAALPAALGLKTRNPLMVALRHGGDAFRVARVFEERSVPRRNILPELLKRERRLLDQKVAEIVRNIGEHGPALIDRLARDRRIPAEKAAALREGLEKLGASGKKIQYRILHDESSYDFRRSMVALESKELARALGVKGDRIVIEFHRRPRSRTWQPFRIRPDGR